MIDPVNLQKRWNKDDTIEVLHMKALWVEWAKTL